VYDPVSGLFVQNELTRELGENCLGAEWHSGCWKADSIDFDHKKHEISAHYFVGVGECGSTTDRYRVENNRLIVVHEEILDMKPNGCTLTAFGPHRREHPSYQDTAVRCSRGIREMIYRSGEREMEFARSGGGATGSRPARRLASTAKAKVRRLDDGR
jgi:hypothetical protein